MNSRLSVYPWVVIFLMFAILAALPSMAAKSSARKGDLVVLDHERWIDTLKGTVKNFGKAPARDVTLLVKFLDRKNKVLGTQRVSVGDLGSGEQRSWSLPIVEKNRPAVRYEFEVLSIRQ
jgi:hypothetical protein